MAGTKGQFSRQLSVENGEVSSVEPNQETKVRQYLTGSSRLFLQTRTVYFTMADCALCHKSRIPHSYVRLLSIINSFVGTLQWKGQVGLFAVALISCNMLSDNLCLFLEKLIITTLIDYVLQ